ncbi:MAG: 3-deoxy-D-manno-octulosonate cytidylyltransferase [Candidatus Omnitrophica bacterium CG1_02_46_14]|nr:MAG: 3-deoxy-D-manno-octulosonate cytidylyltransferase [Candidatus Omnitrophica bacterium CG1_02_46_14]
MNIIGIIPGRMSASRFPGKPLAKITGVPMIVHVWARSRLCGLLNEVYVATCDTEIRDAIERAGGQVIMTKDSHQRASDRCAEALRKVERKTGRKADIAVMIQGDEPLATPGMISQALRPMINDKRIFVVNLAAPLEDADEIHDRNEIKVVMNKKDDALYFSREPIPTIKKGANNTPFWKQVCIIPFRKEFLSLYLKLCPTPLEAAESIDMLRVLEHGYSVRMVRIKDRTYSVDTPKDLSFVESIMKKDKLFNKYRSLAGRFR